MESTQLEQLRSKRWLPKLLLAGVALECLNLFSIATTQGVLQFFSFSANRFYSFGVHAVILWLLLVGREVYRARSERRGLTHLQIASLAMLAVCLMGALIYFQHGARLSADGPHYFVQARSILFDGDLDFSNDYQRVKAHQPIAERYPVGTALFSLPFLLVAHLLLLAGKTLGLVVSADGFGYSYETAFGLAGYFFGVLGLLAVLRVTSQYVSVGMATLSLLTAWVSSFLVWYMVLEPSMPHAMSFAWASFFLCYWLYKRPLSRKQDWIVLGCLAGGAALVRWQNGVLLVLPLLDTLLDSPRSSVRALWAVLASALCFLPQLLFWQLTAGSPTTMPLAEHGVTWDQLSVWQVLYSTNRGLFPWNPVFYLGVIGLFLWTRISPRLGSLFITGFLLQIFFNSNVAIWWAGWSFGGRRFDGCVLFFVVGVAVFFQFLRRRPLVPIIGLCVFLALWNLSLMTQLRRGDIPPDQLTSFRSVSVNNIQKYYERFGFPFASPANWLFARRYEVSPEKFDRLFGHEGYGNFRTDFDLESETFVGRGWGKPEMNIRGEWFRWSSGPQSTFLVPLKQARDYELTVLVRPYEGALSNQVGLRVNGHLQLWRSLTSSGVLRWPLEQTLWKTGINELRFEYEKTAKPSETGSPSNSREPGIAVYRLELIAVPDNE